MGAALLLLAAHRVFDRLCRVVLRLARTDPREPWPSFAGRLYGRTETDYPSWAQARRRPGRNVREVSKRGALRSQLPVHTTKAARSVRP